MEKSIKELKNIIIDNILIYNKLVCKRKTKLTYKK